MCRCDYFNLNRHEKLQCWENIHKSITMRQKKNEDENRRNPPFCSCKIRREPENHPSCAPTHNGFIHKTPNSQAYLTTVMQNPTLNRNPQLYPHVEKNPNRQVIFSNLQSPHFFEPVNQWILVCPIANRLVLFESTKECGLEPLGTGRDR